MTSALPVVRTAMVTHERLSVFEVHVTYLLYNIISCQNTVIIPTSHVLPSCRTTRSSFLTPTTFNSTKNPGIVNFLDAGYLTDPVEWVELGTTHVTGVTATVVKRFCQSRRSQPLAVGSARLRYFPKPCQSLDPKLIHDHTRA
jgi:hypothetical protein